MSKRFALLYRVRPILLINNSNTRLDTYDARRKKKEDGKSKNIFKKRNLAPIIKT